MKKRFIDLVDSLFLDYYVFMYKFCLKQLSRYHSLIGEERFSTLLESIYGVDLAIEFKSECVNGESLKEDNLEEDVLTKATLPSFNINDYVDVEGCNVDSNKKSPLINTKRDFSKYDDRINNMKEYINSQKNPNLTPGNEAVPLDVNVHNLPHSIIQDDTLLADVEFTGVESVDEDKVNQSTLEVSK